MCCTRDINHLVLSYLFKFRHSAVSVDDANEVLNQIEKYRLDISPYIYSSLINLHRCFLQMLPLYCLWFQAIAEELQQDCPSGKKTVASFLSFVADGPAYLSASVSEEEISGFLRALSKQYDSSLKYIGKPDVSSWLSVTDKIYQAGADMLYEIIVNLVNK